jgi:hypothetical protein
MYGLHRIPMFNQIVAREYGHVFPVIPVENAVPADNWRKAVFVKGHVCLGVSQQLFQLFMLEIHQLAARPELALHQHVIDLLLHGCCVVCRSLIQSPTVPRVVSDVSMALVKLMR